MPEGDSIAWLAVKLRRSILGKTVRACVSQSLSSDLTGRTVTAIDSIGKNLLVRFDDERTLHIHLRMLGRVRIEAPFQRAQKERLRGRSTYVPQLRLDFDGAIVTCQKIPVLRLVASGREALGVGPDLLAPDFDENAALANLESLRGREIGDALLVQRALAGIGNVYKSEVLFLENVAPRALVEHVPAEKLRSMIKLARKLLALNVRSGTRVTRSTLRGSPLWVYRRAGEPCFKCGALIVTFHQTRSTYACPACQPPAMITSDVPRDLAHRRHPG